MRGAVVRVKPAGEKWMVLGADGIVPEGLSLSCNQSGPDQASFTLRRDTRLPWRDLLPYTPVDVEVEGCGLVWAGRIQAATPGDQGWAVTCRGWQYHLDDDVSKRSWVHARLADWADASTIAGSWTAMTPGTAAATGTRATIGFQAGTVPGGVASCISIDTGETAASLVLVIDEIVGANSGLTVIARVANDAAAGSAWQDLANLPMTSFTPGVYHWPFSPAKRWLHLMVWAASGLTLTSPALIRISRLTWARNAAGLSAGESVLRASDVVRDAAAMCPLLSTDTSLIQTSGLIDAGVRGIPHLTTEGSYETPRQIMGRANAYHDWLLGVTADQRVFFSPRPTSPIGVMGGWSGNQFQDAGDQADELYNRAVVNYVAQDGTASQVSRTATSPLLALGGTTRTKILDTQATLTQAAAEALADAWLARRIARPARGSITIQGTGALRTPQGGDVTPAETLRWPGQLIRLSDRWDPDTGGLGRDAEVTAVTWTQESDAAALTIDSPTDRLEVVIGRLAALQAARPANY